jgi:hypothetical protein
MKQLSNLEKEISHVHTSLYQLKNTLTKDLCYENYIKIFT